MNTIKASDLRIGNWLHFTFHNENVEVFGSAILEHDTSKRGIQIFTKGGYLLTQIESLQPIVLTPEVLYKCAFEKNLIETFNESEGYYYTLKFNDNKYCDLSFISGDKNGIFEVCLFPYTDNFRYQYLHQIQNAFFAITQTELNVKL